MYNINAFFSKPKIRETWVTMWFGLSTILIVPVLATVNYLFRRLTDPISLAGRSYGGIGASFGINIVIISVPLSIYVITKSIKIFNAGERSWALWFGLIPAVLVGSFWLIMITGELLFPH